jgi:diguanylate cyclase (GGDEF)-like protein/PAS domain S-box-containing protein
MSAEPGAHLLDEILKNHVRFPALFCAADRPAVLFDRSGLVVAANDAALASVGRSFEEVAGRGWMSTVEPGTAARLSAAFARAACGRVTRLICEFRDAANEIVVMETSLTPAMVDGRIAGVYACGVDVTALQRAERNAVEQSERIRELYLVAAATGTSAAGRIATALTLGAQRLGCEGGYFTRIDGDTVTFVQGTGDARGLVDETRPLAGSLERGIAAAGRPIAGDVRPAEIHPAAGAARWYIGTALLVRDAPVGTVTFLSRAPRTPFSAADLDFMQLIGALIASVLERDEQERSLDALAFSDALTGLPNRLMLSDRLGETIASARRHGSTFALHFYDLDGFKRINDVHGHLRGDDVLRTIARRLEGLTRDEGIVARMGGDEFVVVQHKADRTDASRLARHLCAAVNEPVSVEGREHRLSASVGIAFFPRDGSDATTLLERADAALYRVKALGRNAIAFAGEDVA